MNFINSPIVDSKLVKDIVRSYNPLDYLPKLKSLLMAAYPGENFANFEKYDLHKAVNQILMEQYPGEQWLKYVLFQESRKKKLTGAYEIRVNRSRVDFLTINGATTSYEIKSSLDNLDKLAKQTADYLMAFEYNNLVIHESHLKRSMGIIPETFGIITVNKLKYNVVRKPILNENLDAKIQLGLLTKKELIQYFKSCEVSEILDQLDLEKINKLFKIALKCRYKTRWEFIVKHANDILPIDIQFFFNKNIKPIHIYS